MSIPNWLLSSTGEGVALRWKSLALGFLPVVLLGLQILGISISTEAGNELIGLVEKLILAAWALAAAVAHVYGWARKQDFQKKGLGKFANH